ncbi:MAG: condensation domain-containing protein [Actinomycetota bacterium]
MTISDYLTHLRNLGVEVRVKGDRLTCNAPKGALTAELRAELNARKAEILSFLSQAEGAIAPSVPPLQPIPRSEQLPLSFAQERLWLLSQFHPETPIYNIPAAFHLRGRLHPEVLEQSIGEIWRRHETLRATFTRVNGEPVQAIAPPESFHLPIVSLQEVPEADRETQARQLIRQEAQRPFDLERGPLLRVMLIQLSQEEVILLLVVHHIVADGWSFGVLIQELGTLYQAFLAGKPSPLPELPVQYVDFAHWQKQWLQGEVFATQLAYWQQQLDRVPMLQLPTDKSPLTQTYRGAFQVLELSKELSEAIASVSRLEGVSLFMVLLVAFQVLLNRYTEQEDLVLCSPIAGRKSVETQGLIGYFNNIVALRADLSGDPSFRELLQKVRPVVLAAYDHQDIPFQEVAQLPNLRLTPLSRAVFSVEDAFERFLEFPDVSGKTLEIDTETADFDLSWFVVNRGTNLKVMVRYKTDLFSQGVIQEMARHFQVVLESLVSDRDRLLSSLSLWKSQPSHSLAEALPGLNTEVGTRVNQKLSAEPYVAPHDELEILLANLWAKVLNLKEPVGVKDNFFELGGHSLSAVRLWQEIQTACGKNFPLAALFQSPTIEQLCQVMLQSGWVPPSSAMVLIKPGSSQPPLFCIHVLGRGLEFYRPLAKHLGEEQPLYGLTIEIMYEKPEIPNRVENLAAYYIQEMQKLQPQGPYFLAGVSFGGLVAFEMAYQLVQAGEKVALLALLDTAIARESKQQFNLKRLSRHWQSLLHTGPHYLVQKVEANLRGRIEQAKDQLLAISSLFYKLKSAPFPDEVQDVIYRKNNDQASIHYQPKVYPGQIMLFRAIDPDVKGDYDFDPLLGWGNLATGGVETYDIPSTHLGILREPCVNLLAQKLEVCIRERVAKLSGGKGERESKADD